MTRSEIIRENWGTIAEEMTRLYDLVLTYEGRILYRLYIWEDGELERLEDVPGSNTWLQPRDAEPRALFYVTTISAPNWSPWDVLGISPMEDDAEDRDIAIDEAKQLELDAYAESVPDVLDAIIEEAEREEELDRIREQMKY